MRCVALASAFPPRVLDRDIMPASALRLLLTCPQVNAQSPTAAYHYEYRNVSLICMRASLWLAQSLGRVIR